MHKHSLYNVQLEIIIISLIAYDFTIKERVQLNASYY